MKFYLTTALTLVLVVTPLCAFAKSSDSSGVTSRGQGRRSQQQQQKLAIAKSTRGDAQFATITTTRVSTFNT
ncbi:hypothetical protein NUACC26_082230 [Scytonema sp. NUACC26]